MKKEELYKHILEYVEETEGKKKLSCTRAFSLAQTYSIPIREIGACCDEMGIKIFGCQLGCFQ